MGDYKILSLDGGGSWALIQACALGKLYGPDTPGRDILKRFDLVAANSGGSLVAGALAVGMSPSSICNRLFLDETERRKIFVEKWSSGLTRLFGLGPRYKAAEKLNGLRDILSRESQVKGIDGDTPLNTLSNGEKIPDFLITSFDYDRQRAVFFRSNGNSKGRSDPASQYVPPTLAEALHASSNAPVNYFDEPAYFTTKAYAGRRFWDGGTAGLNNPVLAAVIEAIANGISKDDMKVLSIGTGSVMLPVDDDGSIQPPLAVEKGSPGLITDLKKLAKTIVDDPPDAATYEAYRILHGAQTIPLSANVQADALPKNRLIRLNPLIQPTGKPGQWRLPGTLSEEEFTSLVKLDMDAVQQDDVELIKLFCDLWINNDKPDKYIPNQPIQPGDDLSCKIGEPHFSRAMNAARDIGL